MEIKEFSQAEIDDVPDTSLKPWIGFEFFQEMQDRRGDMSFVINVVSKKKS